MTSLSILSKPILEQATTANNSGLFRTIPFDRLIKDCICRNSNTHSHTHSDKSRKCSLFRCDCQRHCRLKDDSRSQVGRGNIAHEIPININVFGVVHALADATCDLINAVCNSPDQQQHLQHQQQRISSLPAFTCAVKTIRCLLDIPLEHFLLSDARVNLSIAPDSFSFGCTGSSTGNAGTCIASVSASTSASASASAGASASASAGARVSASASASAGASATVSRQAEHSRENQTAVKVEVTDIIHVLSSLLTILHNTLNYESCTNDYRILQDIDNALVVVFIGVSQCIVRIFSHLDDQEIVDDDTQFHFQLKTH